MTGSDFLEIKAKIKDGPILLKYWALFGLNEAQ